MSGAIATDWQSEHIPPGIRRPWQVFAEDLEDRLADAESGAAEAAAGDAHKAWLKHVKNRGAHVAFLQLPDNAQRTYADVSLMELSAYVQWRGGLKDVPEKDAMAQWDDLTGDDKVECVPDEPREVLAQSPCWSTLLGDGKPPCGEPQATAAAPEQRGGARKAKKPPGKVAGKKDKAGKVKKTAASEIARKARSSESPAPRSGAKDKPRKAVLVPPHTTSTEDAIHPEALKAVCCICNTNTIGEGNDLCLCDKCDRGYHQACCDPPVATFGNLEDKWFCPMCCEELARTRGLALKIGDFAWVSSQEAPQLWPSRVVKIDFNHEEDPKPYEVELFGLKPRGKKRPTTWIEELKARPWSQGPTLADVRDKMRRDGVAKAVEAGAPRPPAGDLPASKSASATQGKRGSTTRGKTKPGKRPRSDGEAGDRGAQPATIPEEAEVEAEAEVPEEQPASEGAALPEAAAAAAPAADAVPVAEACDVQQQAAVAKAPATPELAAEAEAPEVAAASGAPEAARRPTMPEPDEVEENGEGSF